MPVAAVLSHYTVFQVPRSTQQAGSGHRLSGWDITWRWNSKVGGGLRVGYMDSVGLRITWSPSTYRFRGKPP